MDADLTAADLTLSEKARITLLTARMFKRGLADGVDITDLQRRIQRIETAALRRKHKKK